MTRDTKQIQPAEILRLKLKTTLTEKLPGEAAQWQMATQGRKLQQFEHKHSAAVLIALYPAIDGWRFPLIRRVDDGYVHSGQIGFPGGRIEAGESIVDAALREAYEEIGLEPQLAYVVGRLTALPIPVSGNLVHPVVCVLDDEPTWQQNPREVQELLSVKVIDLLNDANKVVETWQFRKEPRLVPFFLLNDQKVWGATAMMLSEFREVIGEISGMNGVYLHSFENHV